MAQGPHRRRTATASAHVVALVLALVLGTLGLTAAPAGATSARRGQDPTTTTAPVTTAPGGTAAPPATTGPTIVGTPPEGPDTARAWIVVDAATGQVIAGKSQHEPLLAASTVKTMTALVAVDELAFDAPIVVDPVATSVACNCLEGLAAGQTWATGELLRALLIGSDNDVAYALAVGASGSVEAWDADAAALAQRLGLRDSTFTDPAGLDGDEGFRGGTVVSPYDLAVLARNLLAVPDLAGIVLSRNTTITRPDGSTSALQSSNLLLDQYQDAIGVKTGYTTRARASLIGAATRDGRTILTVVLGAEETFDLTRRLLDLGFATPPGTGVGEWLPTVRMGPAAAPFDASRLVLASASATGSTAAAAHGGGGGIPGVTWVVAPVVALLALVVVRRRAVVRRRRARARHRQFMDARRRYLRTAERPDEW